MFYFDQTEVCAALCAFPLIRNGAVRIAACSATVMANSSGLYAFIAAPSQRRPILKQNGGKKTGLLYSGKTRYKNDLKPIYYLNCG